MNKFRTKVLAVIACIIIFILYIIYCTEMGFKHGGGVLVLTILCIVLRAVWKGINSMAEETNNTTKDNTILEDKDVLEPNSSNSMESEINVPKEEIANLPPIPIDVTSPAINKEFVKCEAIQSVPVAVVPELQPTSPSPDVLNKQIVSDIIMPQDKAIRNRNVILIVIGSVVLCIALVFMIISLVEFQVIWDYASDTFQYSTWFAFTLRAHSTEIALFMRFSVTASIILSIQYAIFRQIKSNLSRIIWGVIEIIVGLCTLPAFLSSIAATVFGTLYVVNSLKKLNYL